MTPITRAALIVGLTLALNGAAAAQVLPAAVRYAIPTENQLDSAYDREIADFWRSAGPPQRFRGVRDVEIAYLTIPNPASDVGVVVLNGRTESLIKYKETAYDLWRQGYSVYLLDHRGQGLSGRLLPDPLKGHVVLFDDYVADFTTFMDTVVKPRRYRRLAILAHSMGGAIASLYLERRQNDFAAAVLSAPMHEPNTGRISDDLACRAADLKALFGRSEQYARRDAAPEAAGSFDAASSLTHSERRHAIATREYDAQPEAKLGGPTFGWVAQACQGAAKARRNAGLIRTPVLLLQAGADTVVTPDGQREFCDDMNKAQAGSCRLEPIPGAYHELLVEADEYRNSAIEMALDFIREHTR